MSDPGFFVGYLKNVPAALARVNLIFGALLFALFVVLALLLGRGGDAAAGGAAFSDGELSDQGVVFMSPYPHLVTSSGRTLLLVADGKRGAQDMFKGMDGESARIYGYAYARDELRTVIMDRFEPVAAPMATEASQKLGRWRASGEICDGKCAAGSMHPGRGLSHKACANLCVAGGVPPVLVMATPLAGVHDVLLAAADGGPAPALVGDISAIPVELEGDVERRGNLLIMRVDWAKARRM